MRLMHIRFMRLVPLMAGVALWAGQMAAPAAAQSAGWTAGPGAAADASDYTGFIDTPKAGAAIPSGSTFQVNGWFVDKTAEGWAGADQIQVFSGQMGNGGTMLAQGIVGEARPDVAAAIGNPFDTNSGFSVTVPGTLPAGAQTLGVYLHTPGKGWWYQPLTVTIGGGGAAPSGAPSTSTTTAPAPAGAASGAPQITVTSPTEGQDVSTHNSDFTITGTATSPGVGPSDIDRVDVYIDGEKDTGTLLGEVTPGSDGSWSVTFKPTRFPSTHSNIYVYAHARSTGRETEILRGFNITDKSV